MGFLLPHIVSFYNEKEEDDNRIKFLFFFRVLADSGVSLTSTLPDSGGISIGEALMKPTVIYVKEVKSTQY